MGNTSRSLSPFNERIVLNVLKTYADHSIEDHKIPRNDLERDILKEDINLPLHIEKSVLSKVVKDIFIDKSSIILTDWVIR